jgi:hypothetical protein
MPEARSTVVEKILLRDTGEDAKGFTSERQHSAQSFNLNVDWRDGRRKEGFAWSHYAGYRWLDDGDTEKLAVLFGERALEIEGHNLGVLVAEIRDGQLNGIKELASGQGRLLRQANPDNQPIILGVKSYPDFDDILMEIKGENNVQNRHTRRIER